MHFVLIFFTYCTYCVCYVALPNSQKALQMLPEDCDCVSIQLFFASEEKVSKCQKMVDLLAVEMGSPQPLSYHFYSLITFLILSWTSKTVTAFPCSTRFKALRVMKILARYANLATHWKSCSRQKLKWPGQNFPIYSHRVLKRH